MSDFIDVDKAVLTGVRCFIALTEAVAITKQAMNAKQKNAMKLYWLKWREQSEKALLISFSMINGKGDFVSLLNFI